MAGRGRTALTIRKGARSAAPRAACDVPRSILYTAQDVARFCEVDLKTIHHWADGGKIEHHRTSGRHLRFRRNHLVQFLRRHGYPLHDEIASARPTVFYAALSATLERRAEAPATDEVAKKLSSRFFVRRFDGALAAIAHLVAGEPDAVVVALDDATWAGARTIEALKRDPATSWVTLAIVAEQTTCDAARAAKDAGADLVIGAADIGRLASDLAETLAVD
jgi:excisionase family DNA binding protein